MLRSATVTSIVPAAPLLPVTEATSPEGAQPVGPAIVLVVELDDALEAVVDVGARVVVVLGDADDEQAESIVPPSASAAASRASRRCALTRLNGPVGRTR